MCTSTLLWKQNWRLKSNNNNNEKRSDNGQTDTRRNTHLMVLESHAFSLAVLVNVTAQRVVVPPTSAKIIVTVKTVSPRKKEIR